MNSTLVKGIVGISAVGGVSAGGFFAYKSSQPQNIRDVLVRKGLTLANVNSIGPWKVISMGNKNNDAFFSFLGIVKTTDRREAGSKLQEKCRHVLNTPIKHENYSDLLSKAELWCIKPTPRNLEEQLLMDELETDLSDDDLKNVHKMLAQDKSFTDAIETTKGTESDGYKKVKKWCEVELQKPANSPRDAAKSRCTTPFKNLREALSSSGLGLISSTEAWNGRYTSIKSTDTSLSSDNITESGGKGGTSLSDWCSKEVDKKIHELTGNYTEHLDKVKKRCV
ncbi:hypothetical protein MHC_03800 [Mycoplasma haemocanis str. Illinois]|uniref:Uncharacterized protein n=1 Tax=Mycoplasma haemocanis (strain Illinois) TaxID=1111676 RepID=H6N7J8_MYCHN|nr:hypothetical protein [Mycoplasma haemocanis]AEW45620.1 hypothetical protein MHC_03800 [Mycoplasma haemocanis str. Illinois]